MSEITAISISEIARRRMAAVRSGRETRAQGKDVLDRCMDTRTRAELIEHFTREYHRESVEAFRFFRVF